jgi:hypothetical protein
MAFTTPVTYTSGSHYDAQFVLDVRRLRQVFRNFSPQIQSEIAQAIHSAYPDLLVTVLPSGNLSFEKM